MNSAFHGDIGKIADHIALHAAMAAELHETLSTLEGLALVMTNQREFVLEVKLLARINAIKAVLQKAGVA